MNLILCNYLYQFYVKLHSILPLPNPPLVKGRELDSLISPLSKGGLRGVISFYMRLHIKLVLLC